MNRNQEFTPKYWIGHDVRKDDVFLETASKDFEEAAKKLHSRIGGPYYDSQHYDVSLFEINLIHRNPGGAE